MPKLSAIDQSAIELARLSFPTYMAVVHKTDMPSQDDGTALPAQHHLEMMYLLAGPDEGKPAKPDKDWAKRIRIIYLSHAATKAYQVSLAIKQTIEDNAVYQAIFPAVKPDPKKWSEPEWRLKGNSGGAHANFIAGGIDSPPLGGRGDKIVLDDICDEENMRTAGQRDKVRSTLNKTVKPMFVPVAGEQAHNVVIVLPRGAAKTTIVQGFIEWCIGRASLGYPVSHGFIMAATRWAWEDAVQWAIEEQGWKHIMRKAIQLDEAGEEVSYWPERFSLEYLREERRKDPRSFAQQYQNEVAPEEGLVFEKLWFTRRYDFFPADFIWRYESWDLAQTNNKKSDWSVGLPFNIAAQCPLCQGQSWHYFIGPTMFRGKREYGSLKMAIQQVYQLLGGLSNNHYALIEKKNAGESLSGEGLPGVNLKFVGALGEGRGGPAKREADLRDILEVCRQGRVHFPTDEYLRRTHEKREGQSSDWLATLEQALYSFDGSFEGHTDDMVITVLQGIIEGEWRKQQHQKLLNTQRQSIPWARPRELTRVHT